MKEERLNYYKEWIEENEEIVVDSSIFKELVDEINKLNNIINEAIGFTNSHFKEMVADEEAQALLNILNKGENNE